MQQNPRCLSSESLAIEAQPFACRKVSNRDAELKRPSFEPEQRRGEGDDLGGIGSVSEGRRCGWLPNRFHAQCAAIDCRIKENHRIGIRDFAGQLGRELHHREHFRTDLRPNQVKHAMRRAIIAT